MNAIMIIPDKSSFGPLEVEVEAFRYGVRVRAVRVENKSMTMFSGSVRLWNELKIRGLVIEGSP